MDSALILKKAVRNGEIQTLDDSQVRELLVKPEIITKVLAQDYLLDTFTGIRKQKFSLASLSEIPYAEKLLPYVNR